MEKRAHIGSTVLHLIEGAVGKQRANVCVLISRDTRVAREVAKMGHRLVVVGDRFKPLFRFQSRNHRYNPALAVEARYRELPLSPEAFDVLVVARPMPKDSDVARELERLRLFLKPEGMLMWIHPVYRGVFGRVHRTFASRAHRMERHVLCRIAMEEGFHLVGQEVVRAGHSSQFVLTRATLRRAFS
ncbi:MAG: hypothetical protein JXR76_08465 [Deltaproteobacteria bacterium]|nr:hypothetical protein [Deltaproteobacteria bacterium]